MQREKKQFIIAIVGYSALFLFFSGLMLGTYLVSKTNMKKLESIYGYTEIRIGNFYTIMGECTQCTSGYHFSVPSCTTNLGFFAYASVSYFVKIGNETKFIENYTSKNEFCSINMESALDYAKEYFGNTGSVWGAYYLYSDPSVWTWTLPGYVTYYVVILFASPFLVLTLILGTVHILVLWKKLKNTIPNYTIVNYVDV